MKNFSLARTMASVLLLLFFAIHTKAQVVVATSGDCSTLNYKMVDYYYDGDDSVRDIAGQTFTATQDAKLTEVKFKINALQTRGTFQLELYSCTSINTFGTQLGSVQSTIPISFSVDLSSGSWYSVDVSSLNINVTSGSIYGFKVAPVPSSGIVNFRIRKCNSDVYSDGKSYNSFQRANNSPTESTDANDLNFEVLGTASTPTITVTQSLSAFSYCAGYVSSEKNFTVAGANLTDDIGLKPPSGFEISTTSGSGFADTLTLTQSGGSVSTTTIYVRVKSSATGSLSGNINITSTGATTQTVALSASATGPLTPSVSIASSDADNSICSGTSVTFTATPTNGGASPSYQWKLNGSNVGTNSNTYTTTTLANGDVVKVVLTSNDPCRTKDTAVSNSITTTVTANVTPSVSISSSDADNSICSGTSVTFTAVPTNGGVSPSYQWKKNDINVGTNSTTYTTTGLANGDVVKVILTSNVTCRTKDTASSNSITTSVGTNLTPSVSITSSDADNIYCTAAGSITFTATPVNGGGTPSYQWKKNNINVGTNSPTYTTSSIANNDAVKVILTTSEVCRTKDTASSNTITTTVINTGTSELWLGGISNDWFTGSNWCSGTVPSSTSSVLIPAGKPFYPVLTDSVTVFHLELVTGSTLSLNGNELTVTGTISGLGKLVGSLTSSLVISGSDTNNIGTVYFSNTRPDTTDALLNLTYNRSGKTLILGNTNNLNIYGVITPTAGVLSSGGYLVLKSNSSGTARIAPGSGTYIAGDVTVERYIPNTGRRYRLLTSMVTSSVNYYINRCWMENTVNTSYTNSNPKPGYGTQITGVSNNVNGFDYSQSSQASLFTITNGTSLTYSPVLSAYQNFNSRTGYFLFIRGDRSMALNLQNTNVPPNPVQLPSSATTLRATGMLNTDTMEFSGTGFYSIPGSKNLVVNPYVSPIDWASVYAGSENISSYYTLWDPSISFRGGFVTVGINGVASAGAATNIIQPGQAFLVQATGSGTAKVTIRESHKTSGNNNAVFAPVSMPAASLQASLYYTEGTGYRRLADGTLSQMDNGFATAVDAGDAQKVENWDEGLAIDQQGNYLAIEQRNLPAPSDTLSFYMSKMKLMNYELEVRVSGYTEKGLQPYLVDRLTGAQTQLKNNVSTIIPFSVTTNTASSASNRFYVVFMSAATLPVRIVQFKASARDNGVQVAWQVEEDESVDHYEVERSKDQSAFQKIGAQLASGTNMLSASYTLLDNAPYAGNNFYRLKLVEKSGDIKYSRIERVAFGGKARSVSVFPNPFKGAELQLKLDQWPAGNYRISLSDALGRVVYNRELETKGGNLTIPIGMKGENTSLKATTGVYWLKIKGEGIEEVRKVMRE